MGSTTVRRLCEHPELIKTQAQEDAEKAADRARELARKEAELKKARKNIRHLARDIRTIFTQFFLEETTGRHTTEAIKTFITSLRNPQKFTNGNNYYDASAMIASANRVPGEAPDFNQLAKNLLNLFIVDQHVSCWEFRGKGGTREDSFKTFLGLLLGVEFTFDLEETDADRKNLIYLKLLELSKNTAIDLELRGTLQSICADKFFESCHARPRVISSPTTATVIASAELSPMTDGPGDLTARLLPGGTGAAYGDSADATAPA